MRAHSQEPATMRQSRAGSILANRWTTAPRRAQLLSRVVQREGGQMTSMSLRLILEDHFGVTAGDFSYGSLLLPGNADPGTSIGRYASIGPNVRRFGAAHPIASVSMHPYFYRADLGLVESTADVARTSCDIGDDVWIGAGTLILPGCTRIGTGAVIGAGSIVTKDVDHFEIVVGNPSRHVRYRFDSATRQELLRRNPWSLEPTELLNHISGLVPAGTGPSVV